jgi:crotonobetainyl-CoA:carnitine CoA-transferase CaiB-like acyl-CoA transferase
MSQPLAGLRVLEFSHTIMGPCAGLLMADLGAEVIKIEPPGGDRTRRLAGFAAGFFAAFNRNKQSVVIDLKSEAGQAVLHRMVGSADIVIENYGPGTMEKLGCGYDTLAELNPRLVYLALKGYLAGPWQNRPALDEVVQFQSGLAYMTGPPGRPIRAGASVVDILGAVFGITGILAALRERDTTGQGQRVGSALFESAVFLMGSHMAGSATSGEIVPPMTARRGAWGIYDVFATRDDQLFIGITSDRQWRRFCAVFGYDDYDSNKGLENNNDRVAARQWLIPDLQQKIAELTLANACRLAEEADISWSPVGQPEDLFTNEHLLAGAGLIQTALDTAGLSVSANTLLPALPLEFGDAKARPALNTQPPMAGANSSAVLAGCGFTKHEIEQLQHQGTVSCAP